MSYVVYPSGDAIEGISTVSTSMLKKVEQDKGPSNFNFILQSVKGVQHTLEVCECDAAVHQLSRSRSKEKQAREILICHLLKVDAPS